MQVKLGGDKETTKCYKDATRQYGRHTGACPTPPHTHPTPAAATCFVAGTIRPLPGDVGQTGFCTMGQYENGHHETRVRSVTLSTDTYLQSVCLPALRAASVLPRAFLHRPRAQASPPPPPRPPSHYSETTPTPTQEGHHRRSRM